MSQLELLAMLPLIAQRDQQHHEVVPSLMHLVQPKLALALLQLVQELRVLLQLRERLVVSALRSQRLESMVLPVPQQELMLPSSVLVQM
jgi:hypothetical protein